MTEGLTLYNAIYADGHFERISLAELVNRGGAAGKIYAVNEHPDFVAKIFHNIKKSPTNRKKLEAMILNRPDFKPAVKDDVEYIQIAWPEAILENDEGFCIGYLMPLINMGDAVSLDHLMQKAIRQKIGLPEKYAYRIFAAYNIASMVAALHKKGHYIVDLKPSNVSVYRETMMVAMVDCDGFSIKGEKERYPAEFVSEEYIFPEGMDLDVEDMGEEQDKFALAVMIFKLLNNGIHPFSGVPRKADGKALTIQNRIEEYHYAYGIWPDTYQAPHPYSLHEYFDKKTLEFFERVFVKGQKRPTAQEWQEHVWYLLQNLKICKKNTNHVYFTSKGCGFCTIERRFDEKLKSIKTQKETPQMLRGMSVNSLSTENRNKLKQEKALKEDKIRNITIGGIAIYMLFFALLFKIIAPFAEAIVATGFGIQAIFITLTMILINAAIKYFSEKSSLLREKSITQMLQVYALICMIIAMASINEIPSGLLSLSFFE